MLNEQKRCQRWHREALILNTPLDAEHEEERIEHILDGSSSIEETVALKVLLEQLPERERQVLLGLYFEGRTQREIGQMCGVSQRMVSKIHRQAIQQIREMMLSEVLDRESASSTP
ncbi:sigma-70 family RNA polymerase sigma factor [Alicyclobacillus sp. SP_1]|uniref:sigma-70 family RNA polymerase sigma factor n=1 Tax=Alicyclobacillus sp. SP_1 TaxID=2942475 RepID=UPI00215741E7|nr:sigma-70 family RNA polymerase sigma factor [Alicyclobacillus sp. SP_1]